MLLREHSSCLCRGENGKSFCLAELWPALIVRIQWDFTINAVHAFQNTKKDYFGFTHAPLKFISATRKDKHFIGQLWQLMTASNVGAWTHARQAKWAVFKIEGFVCKRFLPFLPTPSMLFYLRYFSRGLWHLFLVLCSWTAQKRLLRRLESQQQTQPTYGVAAGIRIRATLVGGEGSQHSAIPCFPKNRPGKLKRPKRKRYTK